MRSTLYLKFILLYIIVGFLSIFTVSALSSPLVTDYLEKDAAGTLYQSASLMTTDYLSKYFSEGTSITDVYTQLTGMSSYLQATVWFVEKDGSMIASAHTNDVTSVPSSIEDFNPAEAGGSQYMTGTYHNYFNEEVITVITPVTQQFVTKGYLIIHKPYRAVNELKNFFIQRLLIMVLCVYLFSFIILFGIHFFIYRPLRKITDAATQYASGNLDVVIPVNSQDEMGYLSASLNYMSAQLKDMEDYQKKFVANVSHDFRSPLTSIKGYVEAMADGTIPVEMQDKYLKIILFETERLTDLTKDLLTLNEFDTKHLLLSKTEFDIQQLIKDTAASFEGTCTDKQITIDLLFASRTLIVFADKRKIQ